MTERLLLDEHYSAAIATALREQGHDVVAAVADLDLRGAPDDEVVQTAAAHRRRIVTENIKDFRPLLLSSLERGAPVAPLLLVPPRRFPRGGAKNSRAIVTALGAWLSAPAAGSRTLEEWLV